MKSGKETTHPKTIMNNPKQELPLQGVRVLELANVLAGPSVGMFLAELGAEVVKLENLETGGDVTRSWKLASESADTQISAYFSCANWGKKSIAIDITIADGLKLLYQLVEKTDIVLASYKPGDAEKLKTDFQTLSQYNPQLIYAQLTGYGRHNSRTGYDAIIQAESGFTYMNGEKDGKPVKMPVALMDLLAAHQLKEAILLALLHKWKTGKGQHIEVSLIQSAVSSLANQATNWLVGKTIPRRIGSDHPNIAPYGTIFTTADDKDIVIAVGTDRQFAALTEVLEFKELATDKRFSKNIARVAHRELLNGILRAAVAKKNRADLLAAFEKAQVPAGGVLNMQEVFEQSEVQEMLLSNKLDSLSSIDGVRTVAFRSSAYNCTESLEAPPNFATHTKDILQDWLNLSEVQIEQILIQKVAFCNGNNSK